MFQRRVRPLLDSVDMFGFSVSLDPQTAIESHFAMAESLEQYSLVFACLNPHSLVEAHSNPAFAEALSNAHVLAADGIGITGAARLLGLKPPVRFTGSDCFEVVCNLAKSDNRLRVFLLGSTNAVLEKLVAYHERTHPNVDIVGVYSPPFIKNIKEWDATDAIDAINRSNADVLWVSMTAPKQELWVHTHFTELNVKFIGSIGAVFDFYAGTVRRPGKIWQVLGLEWLGRLIQEPKRLWRRTAISGSKFFLITVAAMANTYVLNKKD